jgi:hypothetical protein
MIERIPKAPARLGRRVGRGCTAIPKQFGPHLAMQSHLCFEFGGRAIAPEQETEAPQGFTDVH